MRFRPCIDIHNGKVKQIVGGSLDDKNSALENYVSDQGAEFYAQMYKDKGLSGGHIIMLNKPGTAEYEASRAEAKRGLAAYEGGMQVGGGINADNAGEFIDAGASHVIVTSYIFDKVKLEFNNLEKLKKAVGRERIVIDLSCRYNNGSYYVVTDRWQTFTEVKVDEETLKILGEHCDEFLIHGVDVEGLKQGIDERLFDILAKAESKKITYAGGVRSYEDADKIYRLGDGKIDYTVGSALKIFGGELDMDELIAKNR